MEAKILKDINNGVVSIVFACTEICKRGLWKNLSNEKNGKQLKSSFCNSFPMGYRWESLYRVEIQICCTMLSMNIIEFM